MKITESEDTHLDRDFAKIAASITCPVLQKKYEKLSKSDFFTQFANAYTQSDFSEYFQQFFATNSHAPSIGIDCYSDTSKELQDRFRISSNIFSEVIYILEAMASIYVGVSVQSHLRQSIAEMIDRVSNFVDQLNKATDGLDEGLDQYEKLFFLTSGNQIESKRYSEAVKSLIKARDELQTLPSFIQNSRNAKMVEYGKRAQPTNIGLQFWVENIYFVWLAILGRSIENKKDGINGRIHLLDFMETLMLPVHEAVEYSTLDNMLRKVQSDIKSRGGFNHHDFKIGGSSPLSAAWSKSES